MATTFKPKPRAAWRRLWMGLATVTGAARRGFFIPYRYADGVAAADYSSLRHRFEDREDAFCTHLQAIESHADELYRIGPDSPPAPRWNQGWFPRLDAAAAYAMVRRVRPTRIVEVGSGHSTRFFARAVADGGLDTRITAIDPAPRADIRHLGIGIVEATVQRAGTEPFAALADGDVLSIDSSHILMPGTDVDVLLNGVLPGLPAGVLVHVHDIFLPDPYPVEWAWRGYNEQLGIATLIQGGGFDILWSSRYVATRMADRFAGTVLAEVPLFPDSYESSLWLRKA